MKKALLSGLVGCVAVLGLSACAGNGWYSEKPPIFEGKTSAGASLVDWQSRPLYIWLRDDYGSSKCYGACEAAWPPLLAREDAKPSGPYSLIKRKDGSMQWAIDDLPLYRFADDAETGDAEGHRVANRVVAKPAHGN